MRAKFLLEVPRTAGTRYASDAAIEGYLLGLGYGLQDASPGSTFAERQEAYRARSAREWGHLPAGAAAEESHVVFFALLPGGSRMLVTRFEQQTAVVRVMSDDLRHLDDAVGRLVRDLTGDRLEGAAVRIVDDEISVYRRATEKAILIGRVVTRPIREAARRHRAEVLAIALTAFAALTCTVTIALAHLPKESFLEGTLERFSTAMMATFFVSSVAFLDHWRQLAAAKGVDWAAAIRRRDLDEA